MNEQFTPELLTKARTTKTPEELMSLAQENGITLTSEQAQTHFSQLHQTGALSDEELDNVAGGGCGDPKPKFKVGDLVRENEESAANWCPKCGVGENGLQRPFKLIYCRVVNVKRHSYSSYYWYDLVCAIHGEGKHEEIETWLEAVK